MKQKSIKLNMMLSIVKGLMAVLFPLITFPYVTKILGVENVGIYNFSNSIVNYLILVAGLGINSYAIREGARIRDNVIDFEEFSSQMFSINLYSSILAYVLMVLLLITIEKFESYYAYIIILSLQIIFKLLSVDWLYSIYEDYLYVTLRSIFVQLLSLILLFSLVKTTKDLYLYCYITVIANAGSGILNFIHSRRYTTIHLTEKLDLKKHIKPIIVLFAMVVTTTIYVSSDTIIIGFICGDYEVGIYSVSVKVYSIVKSILSSLLVVAIPRLSFYLGKNDENSFNKLATEIYATLISFVLPAIVGIIILRKEIVLLLSDQSYLPASSSLAILSIALFFCLGAWFWGQCILVPRKKEKTVFYATIISAITNIVLNIIFIPMCKSNAAAMTTVIAEAIVFFICMLYGKKESRIGSCINIYIKVGIGCLCIAFACKICRGFFLNNTLYIVISIITSVIIYLIVELLLHNEPIQSFSKSIVNRVVTILRRNTHG